MKSLENLVFRILLKLRLLNFIGAYGSAGMIIFKTTPSNDPYANLKYTRMFQFFVFSYLCSPQPMQCRLLWHFLDSIAEIIEESWVLSRDFNSILDILDRVGNGFRDMGFVVLCLPEIDVIYYNDLSWDSFTPKYSIKHLYRLKLDHQSIINSKTSCKITRKMILRLAQTWSNFRVLFRIGTKYKLLPQSYFTKEEKKQDIGASVLIMNFCSNISWIFLGNYARPVIR
ncbi:hypothetical protein CXB51_028856 [Gossypium anomalum]|uniref:Uncharacterized protein n=1 Tax=Gossypium anomalum TaxID=47600 RepID=A0A8J5YKQ8_9ROSI|nr:hypothetical protein CXB51_028856 [Gossypium anomalum]